MRDLPSAARPFLGRTVVLIHPAWVSCGSHSVFVSQARSYRALGARVVSLAVNDLPARPHGSQRDRYFARSQDLSADQREWVAMAPRSLLSAPLARALGRRLRGDQATLRLAIAERAGPLTTIGSLPQVDLVHCNHFFCMPVARRVARASGCPIVLDSHDVQARHYALAQRSGITLPPVIGYDAMFARECAEMNDAALLIHLNDEEEALFRVALPGSRHALLYPALAAAAPSTGRGDLLIVAAANHSNVLSVAWFLREVIPRAPEVRVRIVGTVDRALRSYAPTLYRRHAPLFTGRVDDPGEAYADAAAILLPTVAGHGISIKTIEALSSGAPIIATTLAFRGMRLDLASLSNLRIADDAASFAEAVHALPTPTIAAASSDTRLVYDKMFSLHAHREGLATIVGPLFGAAAFRAPRQGMGRRQAASAQ